jgi:hypothetical protein
MIAPNWFGVVNELNVLPSSGASYRFEIFLGKQKEKREA